MSVSTKPDPEFAFIADRGSDDNPNFASFTSSALHHTHAIGSASWLQLRAATSLRPLAHTADSGKDCPRRSSDPYLVVTRTVYRSTTPPPSDYYPSTARASSFDTKNVECPGCHRWLKLRTYSLHASSCPKLSERRSQSPLNHSPSPSSQSPRTSRSSSPMQNSSIIQNTHTSNTQSHRFVFESESDGESDGGGEANLRDSKTPSPPLGGRAGPNFLYAHDHLRTASQKVPSPPPPSTSPGAVRRLQGKLRRFSLQQPQQTQNGSSE